MTFGGGITYFDKIELKDKFDIIEGTGRGMKDDYLAFVERVVQYISHVVSSEWRLEKLKAKIVDAADGGEYRTIREELEKERTRRHNELIRSGRALNDNDLLSKGFLLFDTDKELYGDFLERERWAEIANHLFLRLECQKVRSGEPRAIERLGTLLSSDQLVTSIYLQLVVRFMRIGYSRLIDSAGGHPSDALSLYLR
ncbi:MAG: hypothetical protein WCP79_14070 [Bacillota bacterium]